jgi:hypothetical protein
MRHRYALAALVGCCLCVTLVIERGSRFSRIELEGDELDQMADRLVAVANAVG